MNDFDVGLYSQPAVPIQPLPVVPAAKGQTPWVLIAIVLLGAWFFWNSGSIGPAPRPDDDTIIVVDDDSKGSTSIKGAWLVFVLEKTSPTADQSMALNDTKFFDELKTKGMVDYRTYDDDQAEAKPLVDWALGRGMAPPLVAVVKDRKMVKAVTFTDRDSIQGMLK